MRTTKTKYMLCGAGLMAAMGYAQAQSTVTLYGAVDNAIVYSSNQAGKSNTYLRQGNWAASKWGLHGNEDLGGGLSTVFDLQAGFDPNTGAAATAGSIFNRQAYVGLSSRTYGTLTAGRQYTPYYLLVGSMEPSAYLTGATGAHPGDIDGMDTTIRVNNAFTYTSPNYLGLQASAMYALGGIAGSTGKGETISAAVRYASGPLSLGVGYLSMNNASTNTTNAFDPASTASFGTSALNAGYVTAENVRHFATAGTYTFGKMMVGLNYSNVRYLPGGRSLFEDTATFNTYGAIGRYTFSPAFDVSGGISYTMASQSNGITDAARYQQYSLEEAYHLSKRTTLYCLQAYQRAGGDTLNASQNIISAQAAVGDSQNGALASSGRNQFVGMFGIATLF